MLARPMACGANADSSRRMKPHRFNHRRRFARPAATDVTFRTTSPRAVEIGDFGKEGKCQSSLFQESNTNHVMPASLPHSRLRRRDSFASFAPLREATPGRAPCECGLATSTAILESSFSVTTFMPFELILTQRRHRAVSCTANSQNSRTARSFVERHRPRVGKYECILRSPPLCRSAEWTGLLCQMDPLLGKEEVGGQS